MTGALGILGIVFGAALAVLLGVLFFIRGIVGQLAQEEVRAWLPHIARDRVRRAAKALPPQQRDILEAWEAELVEFADRPLTMLLVAARISRHRKLIAAELQAAAFATPESNGASLKLPSLAGPIADLVRRAQAGRLWIRGRILEGVRWVFEVRFRRYFVFAVMELCALFAVVYYADHEIGSMAAGRKAHLSPPLLAIYLIPPLIAGLYAAIKKNRKRP